MSSEWVVVLKRATCAALCYGMVFTYPSWTIFGRIAHANPPVSSPIPIPDDVVDEAGTTPPPPPPPVVTPKKPAPKPTEGRGHADGPGKKPVAPADDKKTAPVQIGSNCSDDNFYLGFVDKHTDLASGQLCGSKLFNNAPVTSNCWKQVFTLLGAADANAYGVKSPDPNRNFATAAAADTIANARHFIPSVGDTLARNEDKLSRVLSEMSKKENLKNNNNQECCVALVEKAQGVADYIYKVPSYSTNELTQAAKKKNDLTQLINQKRQQCETGHAGAVVGGGHVAPAPPPPPEKEKKKGGLLWPILIAIGVGLLIWALTRKKDKKEKPRRPTEKPKPCKGKNCGGGGSGGAAVGGSAGGATCPTGNCGNTTAATTGEEPPVTTGTTTYPSTTGDDGRDVTTGGVTGSTYPNDDDNDPGRDNTTGGSATVTGSTTATVDDDEPSTTGSTGNTYPGGDDGDRDTTGGLDRSLLKNRR